MIYHGIRKQSPMTNMHVSMVQSGFTIIGVGDATATGKDFTEIVIDNNSDDWLGLTARANISPEHASRLCIYGIYLVQEANVGIGGIVEARWARDTEADINEGPISTYPKPHDLAAIYTNNAGLVVSKIGVYTESAPQNNSGGIKIRERDIVLGRFDKIRFWAPTGNPKTDYWKLIIGPK